MGSTGPRRLVGDVDDRCAKSRRGASRVRGNGRDAPLFSRLPPLAVQGVREDRAEIELPLVVPVLGGGTYRCDHARSAKRGNVGQPQFVHVICGEVPLDQVVVHGWARTFPVLAALLAEHRPPIVFSADPPRRPLARHLADQELIPVLGILAGRWRDTPRRAQPGVPAVSASGSRAGGRASQPAGTLR